MPDRTILILVARSQRESHRRLNDHGKRLRKVENVMMLGSAALTAATGIVIYSKELVIAWAKKKIGLGS